METPVRAINRAHLNDQRASVYAVALHNCCLLVSGILGTKGYWWALSHWTVGAAPFIALSHTPVCPCKEGMVSADVGDESPFCLGWKSLLNKNSTRSTCQSMWAEIPGVLSLSPPHHAVRGVSLGLQMPKHPAPAEAASCSYGIDRLMQNFEFLQRHLGWSLESFSLDREACVFMN